MQSTETLESQVERLAAFITQEIPGEPSRDEGAIDTAIRLLRPSEDEFEKTLAGLCADLRRVMRSTRFAAPELMASFSQEFTDAVNIAWRAIFEPETEETT